MWTKRKNWKEKKERKSNQQNGAFSLSKKNKFKWNCKTNYSWLPYLSRKFQEYILLKFWHGYNCYFSKYAKHIYMAYSFPISKNAFKMFPNPKNMVMVGYYISQASHPYLVHNFLNFIFATINCFTNCSINRHYIAFNQNANKTFQKLQTNTMLSLQIS